MVTAVLPVYLVFGLGVSLLSVGFVDGLYAGVTVLVSLLAAHVADRTQQRKAVAGAICSSAHQHRPSPGEPGL